MIRMFVNCIVIFFVPAIVWATESESHHGISELLVPAINLVLYLGLFSWKILPHFKSFFREQHLIIANQFNSASEKIKIAEQALKKAKDDIDGVDQKVAEMTSASKRDLDVFRVRYAKELAAKLQQLDADLNYNLKFEQNALEKNFYQETVSGIVHQGLQNIATQPADVKKNASVKLLGKI